MRSPRLRFTIEPIFPEPPAPRASAFQFTIRRAMIVVAILAVILAALFGSLPRARDFERREMAFGRSLPHPKEGILEHPDEPLPLRKKRYNLRMVEKYHFAHRFPFLPVWPDPPEPE